MLTEDEFWFCIDTIDTEALDRGQESLALDPLVHPSKFPKTLEQWFEPLLSATRDAYKGATGKDRQFHRAAVSFETGSNRDGWPDLACAYCKY